MEMKMVVYLKSGPRTIVVSVAALVASAGLLTLAGCESKNVSANAAPPPAMPVSVVKADQKDVPDFEHVAALLNHRGMDVSARSKPG